MAAKQNPNERLARIEQKLDDLIKSFDKCQECHGVKTDNLNGRVKTLEISSGANQAAFGAGYKVMLGLLALGQLVNLIFMWSK